MSKKIYCLISFLLVSHIFCAQNIINTTNPEGWIMKTHNSAYQLVITKDKKVRMVYYGSVEQVDHVQSNSLWTNGVDEVPVRGGYPIKTPQVELIFADGVRDMDLVYKTSEIVNNKDTAILKIVQQDKYYPLEVISYFKTYSEFDIIEKWIELKNLSTNKKDKVVIENLLSGCIFLPHDNYQLNYLSGKQMNEFQLQTENVNPGIKTVEQKQFKSNANPPWFMITKDGTNTNSGSAWYGFIHYSGNWKLQFDKSFEGNFQVAGGVNFWDTNWILDAGKSFTTPKITFGYSNKGTDQVSINLADYVRKQILPMHFRHKLRPVLYNGWENSYYDINEQQQLELANVAKEIGIELFVIDDGWFKDRTDGKSQSGLGNYDIDINKFPNGLKPIIDHVHSLGMKFGLWVEPENININSDVYRLHPDWIFQFSNRNTNQFRKILNFANEEVYNHVLNSLTKLLQENNIDFIKWDQNNYLADPGWLKAPKGLEREARIRHIENVYRLVDKLRKKFPNVAFETCASGGGRVDLGMLSRMDQAWVSDNTDPIDRLFIQHGYSMMLPANTMSSWVTSMTRHQPVSLDYRFDVSMTGVLGVGADITKWSESDKEIARQKITLYKEIRHVVQHGNYYSLISPFETNRSSVQYVTPTQDESVVFCYNLAQYLPGSQNIDNGHSGIKLKGLNPTYRYKVKNADSDKKIGEYDGGFLMNVGLPWFIKDNFSSQILLIEKQD
ncbi:MAG: alpha-galactosidase [Pigmentiphaga sp.]|nr:alpha-galactosidase [Pigmentiphaga sp.]